MNHSNGYQCIERLDASKSVTTRFPWSPSPVTPTNFAVDVRPFGILERFRVGFEILFFGSATFSGELRFPPEVDSAMQAQSASEEIRRTLNGEISQ